MDENDWSSKEKKMRERDAKRQRLYRQGKQEKGKYVNLFVPHDVALKIKGNPSLLVKRFVELSQVMDLIEKQHEEIQELRSRRERRKVKRSQEIEERWLEIRFGRSTGEKIAEQFTDERYRMEKLLAEERLDHARFKKRVYAIIDTTGGFVQKLLDESEGYLNIIQAINKTLLNPRIKNERKKALAIDQIRRTCKSIIEQSMTVHEDNKTSYDRLFNVWSSESLRRGIDDA